MLFGNQLSREVLDELPGLYTDLSSGLRLGGLLNPNLPLPQFRRRDRARERIVQLIVAMMDERRRHSAQVHDDFLATLMEARRLDGTPLTDEVIAGLILTLIFAGQKTTASLATWTGVLLLQNPKHLPALQAEQDDVFRGDPSITVQKLHRLQLLDRCIKEAERMHPPIAVMMRVALKPFHYQGLTVSPGTLVVISPSVSHRMSEVFRDPDNYDPFRFGPERAEDRLAPHCLIGFGGGKHRCIGRSFAYLQAKVIWSIALRTFELKLPKQPHVPDYSSMMSLPKQPCVLGFRR